jgi:hypothetical protein
VEDRPTAIWARRLNSASAHRTGISARPAEPSGTGSAAPLVAGTAERRYIKKQEHDMAPSTGSRENLTLPATRQKTGTSRIPGTRRRRGMLAAPTDMLPARRRRTRQPGGGASMNAGMCPVSGGLSFRRIVDIPFQTCVAAFESWQRTEHDGPLHLGQGLVRGPVEHDPDFGTCRIEVRLARGSLRRPLRMRLDIDHWSTSPPRTALELIPSRRVRPTETYFRAGHLLLDALTRSLPQHLPAQRSGRITAIQPHPHQDTVAVIARDSPTPAPSHAAKPGRVTGKVATARSAHGGNHNEPRTHRSH